MGMSGMMGGGMGMGAMPGQQMMLYGRGMGGYGVGQSLSVRVSLQTHR